MQIIGAGMAGIIAAHYFRNMSPTIIEAQPALPRNHEALLRFRSTAVSEVTGVPFHKVRVRKAIISNNQFADKVNPYLANLYSQKVTGRVISRSIWDTEDCDRYVAPSNFVSIASSLLNIQYDSPITTIDQIKQMGKASPVISTMPMPLLMKLVGWKDIPAFDSMPIWSMPITIIAPSCDVHQTIYYPDANVPQYRASITGNTLIIEFIKDPEKYGLDDAISSVLEDFGLQGARIISDKLPKYQRYGKISPIDEEVRREFMYTMTREFNVYSLGRFATWRHVLLDDIAKDCCVISNLVAAEQRRSSYSQSLIASR